MVLSATASDRTSVSATGRARAMEERERRRETENFILRMKIGLPD